MANAEINDLTLIRRDNIMKLVADMGEGVTGKQAAKKLGISYAAYNGFKSDPPRANVGTKVTRDITAKRKLKEGWLDRDRRNGGTPDQPKPTDNCLSMRGNGFIIEDKRISNSQANDIMKILIEDD